MLSDGAAFTTQSHSSLTSYANSFHKSRNDFFDYCANTLSAIMNAILRNLSVNYGSV